MPGCGNQNDNSEYVAAGRPGISSRLLGGGSNSTSGTGMEGGSAREQMRFTLRQAWNGQAATGTVNGRKVAITPFRAVNNAGDLLNRVDYTSGGSNQVTFSRSSGSTNWNICVKTFNKRCHYNNRHNTQHDAHTFLCRKKKRLSARIGTRKNQSFTQHYPCPTCNDQRGYF